MSRIDIYQKLREIQATTQQNRLLRLTFPRDDAPKSLLVVDRLDASEALSCDFRFEVELLSDDPHIPLKSLLGKLLDIELARGDGTARHFSGYVLQFQHLGTDAGFARYQAILGPWAAWLRLRHDNFIFHGLSLAEQTRLTFEDYRHLRNWDIRLKGDDPAMTDAIQFRENDYNYLHRRWEERGWHYRYEHTADGHQLILGDHTPHLPPVDGEPAIRYQTESGALDADIISYLQPVREATAAHYTVASFDFKHPRPTRMEIPTLNEQGDAVPRLEAYEYTGTYGYPDSAGGDRLARRRMEEIESGAKHYEGRGNNPYLQPGRWFSLDNHYFSRDIEELAGEELLLTHVTHHAHNNYTQDGVGASYENTFVCQRKSVPWRPGRGYNSDETRIEAPQTALVVGPEGQEIHTDEYGRVRVQFHWDREGEYDERSSAWVRVSSNWAGSNYGLMALPRIGQEVIIHFTEGNPDRPIITGRVYNAHQMPPWELASQQALMGIRSKELDGHGFNHLILDDTTEQIQTQLSSTHHLSQLNLGHLTRIAGTEGRKDFRGEGFELRTDAWGAIRAGRGMQISTHARGGAAGHHKDLEEAADQLDAAQERHQRLVDAAGANGAYDEAKDGGRDYARVVKEMLANSQALRGRDKEAPSEENDQPELARPHLLVTSPSGIVASTDASIHLSSESHTAVTSGGDIAVAGDGNLFASVRERFWMFVQKLGLRILALNGNIDLRSLNASVKALAKLKVTLKSNRIELAANETLVLNGGGSYIEFSKDGIVKGTTGAYTVHAADSAFTDPASRPLSPLPDPQRPQDHKAAHFVLADDAAGLRLPNQPYRITLDDGRVIEGTTNAHGETEPVRCQECQRAVIEILRATGEPLSVQERLIHHAADARAPERPPSPVAARQMSDETLELNDKRPTTTQREPLPLMLTPYNFGLRRSVPNHPQVEGYEKEHPGPDRFEIARAYMKKIKAALEKLDWSEMGPFVARNPDGTPKKQQDPESLTAKEVPVAKWPLERGEERLIRNAVAPALYKALQQDMPFGLPAGVVDGAMPSIGFGKYEGMGPNVGGYFETKTWGLYFTQITMQRLMVRDKNKALSTFADICYHEARHCQQFFWILVMALKPPASLQSLRMLPTFWVDAADVPKNRRRIPEEIIALAATTTLPAEAHARIALERLTVSWYYWELDNWVAEGRKAHGTDRTRQPRWLTELEDELVRCKTLADRILMTAGHKGRPIDVTQIVTQAGYRKRPWEEDAFFVGEVVQSYWFDGASPLFPLPAADNQSRGGGHE